MKATMKDFETRLKETIHKTAKMGFSEVDAEDIYRALGVIIQEEIGEDWTKTHLLQQELNSKRMYYLSMEFLTGKFMEKHLHYLGIFPEVEATINKLGYSLSEILAYENEPGLGNGGLGRLAVAFLDSLASLRLPGHGYGLRYEKGLFRQKIINNEQVETADDWLSDSDHLQYKRDDAIYEVKLGGHVETVYNDGKLNFKHINYESIKAEAYDIPIVGYQNQMVNNLRLWKASSYEGIDINEFSRGNINGAFNRMNRASAITQFLYPNDSNYEGRKLRLEQEYFLVSASLQDIVKKYLKKGLPFSEFYNHIVIHTNDTHPALAIPELMRILIDEHHLEWDESFEIVRKSFAFTNHTILSEAMETWDINLFVATIPRIYQIIEEINRKFMDYLRYERHIEDHNLLNRLNIIWDNQVRMVNLSIVGSFSVNGVAKLHTEILKNSELNHFYKLWPQKFNNKTNGIVHRRWLLMANKPLTQFLETLIGDEFEYDALQLEKLLKFKEDQDVLNTLFDIKHQKKVELAKLIADDYGISVNPYSLFDVHIKRIHEYKRQLLNVLHIIYLYDQLKENPNLDVVPRTFIFAGKAAPGYGAAKEIIRLINALARLINEDNFIKDKLKVVFVENYSVSKAMGIIPAADVSEQISTTTKEASGTGNMKFMMNGAITLATLDGANVEISEAVGDDNIVIFGMKADEVYNHYANNDYRSREVYENNRTIKTIVDHLIDPHYFKDHETFGSLYDELINRNDTFFVLKDFMAYVEAQKKISELYRDRDRWLKMSLMNIAKSGQLSSDNTIKQYAEDIWKIKRI